MKFSIRDLLLVTVIVALGTAGGAEPTILVVGSEPFSESEKRFAVGVKEAKKRADEYDLRINKSKSLCRLEWIIDNEYVFILFPHKSGTPVYGIYVSGITGAARYVSEDDARKMFRKRYPTGVVSVAERERLRRPIAK